MAEMTTEERLEQQRVNALKKIAAGKRTLHLLDARDRKRERKDREKRRTLHGTLMEEAGLAEVDMETLRYELGALGKRLRKDQDMLAASGAAEGEESS